MAKRWSAGEDERLRPLYYADRPLKEIASVVGRAGALVYTSFSAASEAKGPSQLAASAVAGRSYQLTGKVVPGYRQGGQRPALPRPRPQRDRVGPGALHRRGARPLPGRARGHRHRAQAGRRLRGREGLARDEVPFEVQRRPLRARHMTC